LITGKVEKMDEVGAWGAAWFSFMLVGVVISVVAAFSAITDEVDKGKIAAKDSWRLFFASLLVGLIFVTLGVSTVVSFLRLCWFVAKHLG
jgi:hypothetical protein